VQRAETHINRVKQCIVLEFQHGFVEHLLSGAGLLGIDVIDAIEVLETTGLLGQPLKLRLGERARIAQEGLQLSQHVGLIRTQQCQ
jgi:hypothetical protein